MNVELIHFNFLIYFTEKLNNTPSAKKSGSKSRSSPERKILSSKISLVRWTICRWVRTTTTSPSTRTTSPARRSISTRRMWVAVAVRPSLCLYNRFAFRSVTYATRISRWFVASLIYRKIPELLGPWRAISAPMNSWKRRLTETNAKIGSAIRSVDKHLQCSEFKSKPPPLSSLLLSLNSFSFFHLINTNLSIWWIFKKTINVM